jgi:tape measure domain-containing protein
MSQTMTLQLRINADGTAAVTALRGVQQGLNQTDRAARDADGGVSRLMGSLKGLALTAAGGIGVAALATDFIEASVSAQKMEKALTAISGSSTAASAELEYVRATADKLGLKIDEAASAYISLSAAAKGTALEGKASRDIFEAVSLAMGKLGKSSADTQGALLAIEQMISKGKVSAEELRGQLGERLPGAFQAAANAMGVTTAELGAMLEKGEVIAEDLLPALSQQLNKLYDDGKAVGGLEAEWARLVNALGRVATTADQATGATGALGSMMAWASGQANNWSEALQVLANWQQGKGFAFGGRDALAADYALRERLLAEYVVKMKDAQAYLNEGDLDNSAARRADGESLIVRINEIDARTKIVRADAKAARAEVEQAAQSTASLMGNGAVQLYQEHQAAIAKNGEELDKLTGKYDKSIAKKAEYAQMEKALTEAVNLGTLSEEQKITKLEAFAAAQDKATAASVRKAQALSAEAQVVADIEQKYGLMAGQLDAVWKLESGRGKTAGTNSERWVKDLAAGEGHLVKIVGQFQMAEGTAKGLGANMKTFNGQADAAAKYLAQAAAQGMTLWEQFAYYHGGPNEKAWGEKTRAYADAAVKIVADATGSMEDLGQNTGKVITDTLNKAQSAVEGLIQRYLPARAAAEEYAQAQQALALASDAAGLSQEEQSIILQGLKTDLESAQKASVKAADGFAKAWEDGVKGLDDTFQSLWRSMFDGSKNAAENIKNYLLEWLADLSYQLLAKPLVVGITTVMLGGSGAAGAVGTATNAASGLSGFSNIGSLFSSIYSLGSTFISGLSEGIMGMFSTNMFSTLGTAWGAVTSGSATGAAAGLGVMSAYALPILAIAAPILGKYFQDQKPRYGAYAATTTGRTDQFEDEVGVKGGFGLTFGMNDMGTANVDAEEMRQLFEGFAAVSTALENFYGKDVSSQVTESLSKASLENWGKNGLMNYAMNAEQAFQIAFTDIIKHAAATGDAVAVVMSSVVGSLQGTMEDMANQIERGMLAAKAAVGMAEAFQGQEIGDRLGLGAKDTLGNALKLVDYAKAMQTSGETTAEAIGRMALNLGALDAAMTLTGTQTDATGMAFIDLANSLAKVADDAKIGMQGLMQLQAAYYQNFFTEEERAIKQKENSLKAIERWNKDQGLDGIDTSAEFRAYVESLDLTTEAGQKAYVEAMKIVAAFISLDDALKKIGDTIPDVIDAFEAQRKTLRDMADQLDPSDPLSADQRQAAQDALRKAGYAGDIYDAKGLAAFLRALSELDDAGGDAGAELQKFIDTFTGVFDELARIAQERSDLTLRLLELQGDDEAILAERRRRELEAVDESNRDLLRRIYLLEDEQRALETLKEDQRQLTEDAYQQRVDAINAEREALDASHQAQLDALAAQRDAAAEALTAAQGLMSSITAAISGLRGQLADEFSSARASQQLANWASAGTLPNQEALDRTLGAIGKDKSNYATAAAYELAIKRDLANLIKLQDLAGGRVDFAEQTVRRLEEQAKLLDQQHQERLQALEDQLQQAEDWRDAELERIDALVLASVASIDLLTNIDQDLSQLVDQATPAAGPADAPLDYVAPDDGQLAALTALREEVILLRKDLALSATAQVVPLQALDDRTKKWDLDGLPVTRDTGAGTQTLVLLKAA